MTSIAILLVLFVLAFVGIYMRRGKGATAATGIPRIRGPGSFSVEVVGESFHADAFAKLARRHKPTDLESEAFGDALLTLEPNNPHDPHAVSVSIEGLQVGYLSREVARDFRAAIKRDGLTKYQQFGVGARLYWGGDDELHSVQLDLPIE